MRMQGKKGNCRIWLSADDTHRWAHRPGSSWPCSSLSGRHLRADIQGDNLVDLTINGKYGDCDGHELDAILADFGARGAR